jgi:hypothetical protein
MHTLHNSGYYSLLADRISQSLVFVNAIFADLVTIVDDRADAVGAAERRCDRRSIVGPTRVVQVHTRLKDVLGCLQFARLDQ